jgi:hypothetical protein
MTAINIALRLKITLAAFLAIILFAAPSALAQTDTNQIRDGLCAGANLEITDDPRGACEQEDNALQKVSDIIRRIVNLLSVIVGVVAVIMIIVGGFRYVTSGGSDASVTGAKNTILYAVIGLIIVALAQVIVNFVLRNLADV